MPLLKPALAAVAVFGFVGNWNSLLGPLIYLRSEDKFFLAQRTFVEGLKFGGLGGR